jgi:hypothetical protein
LAIGQTPRPGRADGAQCQGTDGQGVEAGPQALWSHCRQAGQAKRQQHQADRPEGADYEGRGEKIHGRAVVKELPAIFYKSTGSVK